MRILSTRKERKSLLERLHGGPDTPEIRSAIKIVEEAELFSELRDLIAKAYSSPNTPETFDEIIESKYVNNELRPLGKMLDEIYTDIRAQKFKHFYGSPPDDYDLDDEEKEWQIL